MKTALIVDDSRLARTVLGRLLAEHGVAADTAPTAEAALDYLKERRPDVVFLDHNMPGMDGFEALEAIKANPATATIPVMMYTSQEGEIYVGQARALGALGVLPKSLHPVEVTNVLRTLHLIPSDSRQAGMPSEQPTSDTQRLRVLIEELFYEQAAVLREEIRSEFRRAGVLRGRAALPAPADAPATPPPEETEPQPRRWPLGATTAVAVAVVLGLLYAHSTALLQQANERTTRLADDAAALANANAALSGRPAPATGADPLPVLEWAANRGNDYPFGMIPLDDTRAAELTELIGHLEQAGFSGAVIVEVHVGRFCMSYRDDGSLAPAPADLPAARCDQIGWPELEAMAIAGRQSVGFANTIAAATRGKAIRVEPQSYGASMPLIDYPLPGFELTAGEWNSIAARNQRVEIRLLPDLAN